MSHRHILIPVAALVVAACGDHSLIDSGPIPASSEVASITLAADSLTLDMRSAVPQTIRYSIVNAAGESLCGRMPVSVQTDTVAFTAQLSAADPCLIVLTPRAERSGWLRVQAGTKQATASVSVHRRRYRWAFDLPSGPQAAGSILHPSLTVWGENDKPMAGLPVFFELGYYTRVDTVTGPDGIAHASFRLPTSTMIESINVDSTRNATGESIYGSVGGDVLIEAQAHGEIAVVGGAAHHVDIYIYRLKFYEFCGPGVKCEFWEYSTAYEPVRGDSVGLLSYEDTYTETTPPQCEPDGPCFPGNEIFSTRRYQRETLVAVVADQYGNPTAILPTLSNPAGTRVESRERFMTVGKGIPPQCCVWNEWLGGRALAVFATDNVYPKVLTFTSPGIPARTVTLRYGG